MIFRFGALQSNYSNLGIWSVEITVLSTVCFY